MIGPLPHGQSFLTVIQFASAPVSPGVRLKAADGSTAVARSASGIVDMGSNQRAKLITPPSIDGFYLPQWDDNGGAVVADEAVWVSAAGVSVPVITGDANGNLVGKTFLIKRNDTLPAITRQLIREDSGAPVVLAGTETVKFTMRISTDVTMGGTAKIHATATITDAANGIVTYQWVAGDTDTTTYSETSTLGGFKDTPYAAEFEVNYADGTVETFPQSGYIAVSIPPDLDPGVTP